MDREDVRLAVYDAFRRTGTAPTIRDLATTLAVDAAADLTTLWRLASGWYAGRFERGYTRREPTAARDYFRSVGLEGPFWGL